MEVVIGRVVRAHGIRGELSVEVRTDQPEDRFAVGAVVLARDPRPTRGSGSERRLRIAATRWHGTRLLVTFEELADRTAAEEFRGRLLVADVAPDEDTGDPDDFYDHQLVGLAVHTVDGAVIGTVTEVVHLPMQDLLAVGKTDGGEVLVPLVRDIVPEVDLAERRVVVDPPAGLLDGV